MEVTGWSNGQPSKSGVGYGLAIRPRDREKFFDGRWSSVTVEFPDGTFAEVRLSSSFWRDCPELRSATIGAWLLRQHLAPWTRGKPPRLTLEVSGPGRFGLNVR